MAGSTAPASIRTSGDAAGGVILRFGLSPTLTQPATIMTTLSQTEVQVFIPLLGSAGLGGRIDGPAFLGILADSVGAMAVDCLGVVAHANPFAADTRSRREGTERFHLA